MKDFKDCEIKDFKEYEEKKEIKEEKQEQNVLKNFINNLSLISLSSLTKEERKVLIKAISVFEESTKEIFEIDKALFDDGSEELPDSSDELLTF